MLAGLIELLDRFIDTNAPGPTALGCVPLFTEGKVATRLARMKSCIVIDKKAESRRVVSWLHQRGSGVPLEALPGLEQFAPRNADRSSRLVGPFKTPSQAADGPVWRYIESVMWDGETLFGCW